MGPKPDPDYDSAFLTAMFTLYGFAFIFGVVGNLLIITLVMVKESFRRRVNSTYIFNLAFADILVLLFAVPVLISSLEADKVMSVTDSVCSYFFNVGNIAMTCSVLTLALYTFDRYRALRQPLKRQLKHFSVARMLIITIWIACIAINVPLIRYYTEDNRKCITDWPNRNSLKSYTVIKFSLQYIFPVLTAAFVLTSILPLTKQFRARFPSVIDLEGDSKAIRERSRMLVQKMMTVTILKYALLSLPYWVGTILEAFYQDVATTWSNYKYHKAASDMLYITCASLNIVIYIFMNFEYRRGFIGLFKSALRPCMKSMSVDEPYTVWEHIMTLQAIRRTKTVRTTVSLRFTEKEAEEKEENGSSMAANGDSCKASADVVGQTSPLLKRGLFGSIMRKLIDMSSNGETMDLNHSNRSTMPPGPEDIHIKTETRKNETDKSSGDANDDVFVTGSSIHGSTRGETLPANEEDNTTRL